MHDKLDYQLIDQIANAESLPGLGRLLHDVANRMGALGYFCGIQWVRPIVEPVLWAFSSDPSWNVTHEELALLVNDPLSPMGMGGKRLFFWETPVEPVEHMEFWGACSAARFQHGMTLSVQQEPAWSLTLSFAAPFGSALEFSSDPYLSSKLHLSALSTMHCLIRRVLPNVAQRSLPKISEREINCLKLAARGNTASEIGLLMGLSEATVVFHLNNLMKKFKVNNRSQAIAVGVSLGLAS